MTARLAERDYFGFVVDLESFAGPLDLLLSLIRKEELDILDIPIAQITDQYLTMIDQLRERQVEVAGEFMVMAATLMQIKSRMLLPRPVVVDGEEEDDPRRELVELLLEYERYQEAATLLESLAEVRAKLFEAPGERPEMQPPEIVRSTVAALFQAYERVLTAAIPPERPGLRESEYSVREQADLILARLASGPVQFAELFLARPTRLQVVVTFMALLELIRDGLVGAEQEDLYAPIRLRRTESDERTASW